MDKNTVVGFSLIFVLMLGWFYFTLPSEEQLAEQQRQRLLRDSLAQVEQSMSLDVQNGLSNESVDRNPSRLDSQNGMSFESALPEPSAYGMFGSRQDTTQRFITIETPLYSAVFTMAW